MDFDHNDIDITPISFPFEIVKHGEVIERKISIVLKYRQEDNLVYYSIPTYGVANLFNFNLYINFGFSFDPIYRKSDIFFDNDFSKKISRNQLLKLSKRIYRNQGIDLINESLDLERVEVDFRMWSKRDDDYAPLFAGKEFLTKEYITLESLKGKYVFLDFWGSWCGPCIKEIPNIKKAITELKELDVVFLGIANDSKKALKQAIKLYDIEWPQILSDKQNLIKEVFDITSYPTTLFLGPDGKIIGKNIQGESIADFLRDQIELYNLVLSESIVNGSN